MTRKLFGKLMLIILLAFTFSVQSKSFNGETKFGKNFINVLVKKEFRELRIAFKGILVLETSAFQNSSYEMHFRQVLDGRDLIQLIFQNGLVKDCEYSKEPKQILDFIHKFSEPVEVYKTTNTNSGNVFKLYKTGDISDGNSAVKHFRNRKDLKEFRPFVKIKSAKKKCNKLVEDSLEEDDKYNSFQYIRIKNGKRTQTKNRRKKIKKHNRQWPPYVKEGGDRQIDNNLVKHNVKKRSVVNKFLMFPGTKWCGRGQTAVHYHELGEDKEADLCCRDHDCCPDLIPSFSTKFNVFNYRFHAVLHCECDSKFRWCLKQSYSPMASLIGRIYFNIMGSKCFTLTVQNVCAERSWWGYCLKYDDQPVAHIKAQDAFNET